MFNFFKDSFSKIKKGLLKTRDLLVNRLTLLLRKPWDENTLSELEQILYEADMGSSCVEEAIQFLRTKIKEEKPEASEVLSYLKEFAEATLKEPSPLLENPTPFPFVLLVIGVNGSGKTTSCAKLALHYKEKGYKVLLAAADTFRVAANEQLEILAKKLDIDLIKSQVGADPAAVAFDALQAAKARNLDIVIIDTAGRLHSKTSLMQELEKVRKVLSKVVDKAPHATLLVLDATTGQNALIQAKTFHECSPLTGFILTKVDSSSKAGFTLALSKEMKLPIYYLGFGEGLEDFIPFEKAAFSQALFDL